jgi:hypothetical protein
LRALDHQRARFAQLRVCLEQEIFLLEQFQGQNITRIVVPFRINMEREIFARSQPVFRSADQRLPRLTDHLELVVAEQIFQRSFQRVQLGRDGVGLLNVVRHDQPAPNRSRSGLQGRGAAQH